jgi:hypothetical protein
MDSHIRENLAVDFNLGFFQSIHELAVIEPLSADCGINSGNPESAKFTFAVFPVSVGITQTMFNSLSGFAETCAPHTAVTLG